MFTNDELDRIGVNEELKKMIESFSLSDKISLLCALRELAEPGVLGAVEAQLQNRPCLAACSGV